MRNAARLSLVESVLTGRAGAGTVAGAARAVRGAESTGGRSLEQLVYLVLAVVSGRIPTVSEIEASTRSWRTGSVESGIAQVVRLARTAAVRPAVRVVSGTVVDVTDTMSSRFTTGIQRVARETVARWGGRGDVTQVVWGRNRDLHPASARPGHDRDRVNLVPWDAVLVLPEISTEPRRTSGLASIARHGSTRSVAVGFDVIPITSSETAGAGMPGQFSRYLSTLAVFSAVAAISDAAAAEFRGWRSMLSGAGLAGPEVTTVPLPSEPPGVAVPERAAVLAGQLAIGGAPIVLTVGSHEPRKNHMVLLHAAELAWREGVEFDLVLVGGNSWNTTSFDRLVDQLRRRGRRILTLSGVRDEDIWDLYSLARFSVFPSLNEGFGLPVVESLSIGTPVITSDFGSMADLGRDRGALLVDPRDPRRLADAMVRMLTDDELISELRLATRRLPPTTWSDYADELWRFVHPAPVAQSS